MEKPNFRILGWKMVCIYLAFHLGMLLLTFRSKMALSWQEHMTAANWALPGLVVYWLMLRWACPLYRQRWLQRIFALPFLGGYLQILALAIPLSIYAATVLTVGEGLHPRSLWTLISVVGVSIAVAIGQRGLVDFYAERAGAEIDGEDSAELDGGDGRIEDESKSGF